MINLTREQIEQLPVHFILCTERTGSSLLSLIFNIHPQVLSVSEEPFAVFFYKKYQYKTVWTSAEIHYYAEEFWLMAEKNLGLFFTSKENLINALEPYKNDLPYGLLIRLTYLQFIEPKPKAEIRFIVDKQIKYFFYLPLLCEIFPEAKFCILVRDVRDNVVSKSNHRLNSSSNAVYLSSLWKYTYSNIRQLERLNRPFIICRYEDLATQPEPELKTLCHFFGIDYRPEMVKTEGLYEHYLELRKDRVDPAFIEYLKVFQKSLYTGIHAGKIGVYKTALPKPTELKIVEMNKALFDRFHYEYEKSETIRLSFGDTLEMGKAYLYRPFLLWFYYQIPFGIKILIKRIRK